MLSLLVHKVSPLASKRAKRTEAPNELSYISPIKLPSSNITGAVSEPENSPKWYVFCQLSVPSYWSWVTRRADAVSSIFAMQPVIKYLMGSPLLYSSGEVRGKMCAEQSSLMPP